MSQNCFYSYGQYIYNFLQKITQRRRKRDDPHSIIGVIHYVSNKLSCLSVKQRDRQIQKNPDANNTEEGSIDATMYAHKFIDNLIHATSFLFKSSVPRCTLGWILMLDFDKFRSGNNSNWYCLIKTSRIYNLKKKKNNSAVYTLNKNLYSSFSKKKILCNKNIYSFHHFTPRPAKTSKTPLILTPFSPNLSSKKLEGKNSVELLGWIDEKPN